MDKYGRLIAEAQEIAESYQRMNRESLHTLEDLGHVVSTTRLGEPDENDVDDGSGGMDSGSHRCRNVCGPLYKNRARN